MEYVDRLQFKEESVNTAQGKYRYMFRE